MILHAVERGTGAPVALLHGLFGQAGNFATIQRLLAAGGRRVLALDLRNHGRSPRAPAMTYPGMADDVLETLRAVGALPCALIGHSMGGKVAMWAALAAPATVSRLLVADIAPVAYPHAAEHGGYLAAMATVDLRPGLTRAAAEAALAPAVPDARVRGFLLHSLVPGSQPHWRLDLAAIQAALPALVGWPERVTGRYDGPTLFLSGARSSYVRAEHRPVIRDLFPRARFATLRNAGHWLHADDPEGFATVAGAFLAAG
jgi:pimeloyl-ACP methyl ester carboxylesterase